jgi:hypothetical protein
LRSHEVRDHARLSVTVEAVRPSHQPSIRSNRDHDFSCEHPVAPCGPGLGARASNQFIGLACADQGHPRTALDGDDGWIRRIGAQHPVQPHGQLPGCGHPGHSLRLPVREVQILALELRFQPHRRLCGPDQQHPHQAVALLGDRTQSLLAARAVFAWNQSRIAGNVLTAGKAFYIADGLTLPAQNVSLSELCNSGKGTEDEEREARPVQ